MVRTKAKKPKGDDAFQTKKQKVGRKKLAPATATRAEVHARTLRLNTSSVLAHAPTGPPAAHPQRPLDHPSDHKRSRKEEGARAREEAAMAQHTFTELLAALHHYKAANRASAFSAMTKVLLQQEYSDLHSASNEGNNRFAGFVSLPRPGNGGKASESASSTAVTPLERLKAYTAALEAITDTDDDVRRAALGCLAIILRNQWLSSSRPTFVGSSSARGGAQQRGSLSSTITGAGDSNGGASTLEELEAAWSTHHEGSSGAAAGVFGVGDATASRMPGLALMTDGEHRRSAAAAGAAAQTGPDVTEQDRMKAGLQTVHIAFTHAMKGVRLSGVELLSLLLANARRGAVMLAARAVSRQQRALLPPSLAVADGGEAHHDGDRGDPQERAKAEARLEEQWMVDLLKRLSQLVLNTKQVYVLPSLLSSLLASLPIPGRTAADEDARGKRGSRSDPSAWQHPDLIADFFSAVLPQWANTWKELMELQLGLLRQEDKCAMAVSLGRAFAIVLNYLKREQMARNVVERQRWILSQQQQQPQQQDESEEKAAATGGAPISSRNSKGSEAQGSSRLLSKAKQQTVKELFIHKVPITIEEILKSQGNTVSSHGSSRVDLALVLAQVCTPLAGTDEGWAVLERFFRAIFLPSGETEKAKEDAKGRGGPQAVSPLALLHSLRVYLSLLQLFPKRLSTDVMPLENHAALLGKEGNEELTAAASATRKPVTSGSDCVGGLWAAAAAAGNSFDHSSGSAVFEKLILFAPSIVQAVVQFMTQYQQQRQQQPLAAGVRSSAANCENDAVVLVQLLLDTSEVVSLLAHYPLPLSGGSAGDRSEKKIQQAVGEALSRVPRLLFSLRPQAARVVAVPSLKRGRSDGKASSEDSNEEEEGEGRTSSAEQATRTVDPSILADHPMLVDLVVQRFLQPIWFMASSGHPLLTVAPGAGTSFRDSLRTALQPLFGLTPPAPSKPMVGVLARCSPSTVAMAQKTLFFLGVRDATRLTVVGQEQHQEENGTFGLDDILLLLP